jgi:predicted ArsR family transcriptional regulator
MHPDDAALDAVGTLADPARRALYRYVASAGHEVGRDEAATAAGLTRALAAFHLDKLVEAGLLAAGYKRLTGKAGPGAGRPAKVYTRVAGERAVHLPPRDYPRAAELLASVVEDAGLDRQLQSVARRAGRESTVDGVAAGLLAHGYEPERDGTTVRLLNCPFHTLARAYPPLVCGMNLALIEGMLAAAPDGAEWTARMDPHGTGCCVSLKHNAIDNTGTLAP